MLAKVNELSIQSSAGTPAVLFSARDAERKLSESQLRSDQASISDLARTSVQNHLDLSASSVLRANNAFNFNLVFNDSHTRALTAKGYYQTDQQSLSMNMNYQFQQIVRQDDGTYSLKNYQAEFQFSMEDVKSFSKEAGIEKEDIVEFLRRIIGEIMESASDKSKKISGVTFTKEDLAEIMSLMEDNVAKEIVHVLSLAITIARLQNIIGKKDKDAELVEIKAQRSKMDTITKKQSSSYNIQYSMKITELGDAPVSEKETPKEK